MRTGLASVEELVAHGGWLLDDVQARHAANPDTFWLPPDDLLARLVPGATARLIFQVADLADPVIDGIDPYDSMGRPNLVVAHERMWLWIESIDGTGNDASAVGVLMNVPLATHTRLIIGARVRFRLRDVIDVDLEPERAMADELAWMEETGFPILDVGLVESPEDRLRDPTIAPSQAEVCRRAGVRPERPSLAPPLGCLLGRSVTADVLPIYGGRSRPKSGRMDSGWTIWATHGDVQDAANDAGFDIVAITEVKARNDAAWRYLALPPGWAFVLGPDGYEDVYWDPALLE